MEMKIMDPCPFTGAVPAVLKRVPVFPFKNCAGEVNTVLEELSVAQGVSNIRGGRAALGTSLFKGATLSARSLAQGQ
jgi:hypothetical protein